VPCRYGDQKHQESNRTRVQHRVAQTREQRYPDSPECRRGADAGEQGRQSWGLRSKNKDKALETAQPDDYRKPEKKRREYSTSRPPIAQNSKLDTGLGIDQEAVVIRWC
jgi:hypothetical protein